MKLKNLTEILGNLIDRTLSGTNKLNDFTFGSVIMSIYESFAMELEQYYTLSRENILWGIEHGIYDAYGFTRNEARRAYGDLTIEFNTSLAQNLYIPRGSTFHSRVEGYNQRFETLQDYTVPAGTSSAVIRVYCTEAGTIGNVPAMTVNGMINNLTNIRRVYNANAFLTGQARESVTSVKKRFQEYIETRGRATNKSIEYAARQVPDVAGVYLEDLTGYLRLYIHDLNGDLPDSVKQSVVSAIEDYRPAGIPIDVFPVKKRQVDLEIWVDVPVNMAVTSFKIEIRSAVENYLNGFTASDDLIVSDLIQEIMNIDDYNILDVRIEGLDGNLEVESAELIRAGSVKVFFEGVDKDV